MSDRAAFDEASHVANAARPQYVYRYVLTCAGNSPSTPADNVTCDLALTQCGDGELFYWLYRSVAGQQPPRWQQIGSRCVAQAEAAADPVFPGFTLEDLRRLPLPAATASLQPGNGYAVVQVPTNVVAGAAQVVLDTDVVGFPVRVRATPARYSWDFGDGGTIGPTREAGAPYPALLLTHTYTRPGDYGVVLTTRYTGEYSVAGGPWVPIDGEALVASPAVPLVVLTGHGALVADGVGASGA